MNFRQYIAPYEFIKSYSVDSIKDIDIVESNIKNDKYWENIKKNMKVVVSTIAFSKNKELVNKLLYHFPDAVINTKAKRYKDYELVNYYKDADAIVTGLEKIDNKLLSNLPKLKYISKYGVGLNNIDILACKKRNIKIGWEGGVNKYSVAEMVIGLIIMLSRNLYVTSNQLKNNRWNKSGGRSLAGKTIGIIGLGNIGRELVRLLKPFKLKILANDILDLSSFGSSNNIQMVDKNVIFKKSNIISIHTPLTELTENMINKSSISKMRSDVIIINTARGKIINEYDLKKSLLNKRIAGAALDVYSSEPPEDKELIKIPNLICTPHIAGNSYEAVFAMGIATIKSLINFKKEFSNK